jgi:hypothetical protein
MSPKYPLFREFLKIGEDQPRGEDWTKGLATIGGAAASGGLLTKFLPVSSEFAKKNPVLRGALYAGGLSAGGLATRAGVDIARKMSAPEAPVGFAMPEKEASDMPPFLKQDRPAKVKEIYRALRREHPEYSAEKKARIAIASGQKQASAPKLIGIPNVSDEEVRSIYNDFLRRADEEKRKMDSSAPGSMAHWWHSSRYKSHVADADSFVEKDSLYTKKAAADYPGRTLPVYAQTIDPSRITMSKEASGKSPRLTFLTGGAGAGKSTMAQKMIDNGEFDVLIGTDTGGVVDGQYVMPPEAEKKRIRDQREALALEMRAKGKRVLVEGYPRGALRYPKLLEQADEVLYLDAPLLTRVFRVGKRSRERGTPMLPDLKMALTTHIDDLKHQKDIEQKSPRFRRVQSYEEATKQAEIEYRGRTFPGYNQPIDSDRPEKKKMVLAKKGDQVKLIHFGQKGYKHNYSDAAKKNYLTRSAGIRGKDGSLTANDKLSANYWARRELWPKNEPADGSAKNRTSGKQLEKKAGRPILQYRGQVTDPRWWYLNKKGNPASKTWLKKQREEAVALGESVADARGDYGRPFGRTESHLHGAKGSEGIHFYGTLSDARNALKSAKRGNSTLKEASFKIASSDDDLGHGMELAGLGILGAPAVAHLGAKIPGVRSAAKPLSDYLHKNHSIEHAIELGGLGVLGVPAIKHFMDKRKKKKSS